MIIEIILYINMLVLLIFHIFCSVEYNLILYLLREREFLSLDEFLEFLSTQKERSVLYSAFGELW